MFVYGRQGPPKIWGKGERAQLGPATPLGGLGENPSSCDCHEADTDGLRGLTPNECSCVDVADLRGFGADAPSSGLSTLMTAAIVIGGLWLLTSSTMKQTRSWG